MKLKLSILLLITLSLPLFSLDIAVVPLERLGLESDDTAETLEEELVRAVEEQDTLDALNMIMIGTNSPVASLLDAASTAVRNSRDYLLYGAVVSNPDWIEVRLSLYERESDSIRTVFYDKAASERFEEVPEELALRIVKFVYGAYGIEDRRLYTPDPAYLEAYGELGYWGLFPGEWNDVMTGFFHGGFGVSVGLPSPGLVRENFELYPCFGFLFDYAMGANRPDYESATYHSFQFAVPLEASCRFNNGHAVNYVFAPGYQLDLLNQSRKYGETVNTTTGAFLIKTGPVYTYTPPGRNIRFGLSCLFDFTFYDDLMVGFKPSFRVSYKTMTFQKEDEDE